MLDTRAGQFVGAPIPVEEASSGIAITPDGKFALVAKHFAGDIAVIDTRTNQVAGLIPVEFNPSGIAISPDGKFAYVPSGSLLDAGAISTIDIATRQTVGTPIQRPHRVGQIAVSPDGKTAYVAEETGRLMAIDLLFNKVVRELEVGPAGPMAVTPDGKRLFVSSVTLDQVSVIDTESWQILGPPIEVGPTPTSIDISPDGRFAYVTNRFGNSISVIDTQAAQVVAEMPVGNSPESVTFAPGGDFAYVTEQAPGGILTIDTRIRQAIGAPIEADPPPGEIAVVPNQAPVASFSYSGFRLGVPGAFDGTRSSDLEGQVARYDWSFGDGQVAMNAGPRPSHVYSAPGTYHATLTVTDNEGCSNTVIFTGQTASCNGSPQASQTQAVTVAAPTRILPAIRVRCPARAEGRLCRFKLRAVATKKKNSRTLSAITRVKVKRGSAATVLIKPKPRLASRLAATRHILLRGTRRTGGSTKYFVHWFKVVRSRGTAPQP